jgi:hypothetical protein
VKICWINEVSNWGYCWRDASGPIVEEITDDEADRPVSPESDQLVDTVDTTPGEHRLPRDVEVPLNSHRQGPVLPSDPAFGESLNTLNANPDMIRYAY